MASFWRGDAWRSWSSERDERGNPEIGFRGI